MRKTVCALALVVFLLAALCGCRGEGAPEPPERVTLLIEAENRILTLDYTEYLAGCIFAAAEPSYKDETLLAAGIACGGRALRYMQGHGGGTFGADLSDSSPLCPDWLPAEQAKALYGGDYSENLARVEAAARQAANLCPMYGGAPADAQLCALSCGVTDDGGLAYLPSRELGCDAESPRQHSRSVLTGDYVREALRGLTGSVILPPDMGEWFTDAAYTEHGALISVRFGGSFLTGRELCRALELRSTCVEIAQSDEVFTFDVRGKGGNTGMSVYAAERLARGGKSAEDIISYFYPGVELRRLR